MAGKKASDAARALAAMRRTFGGGRPPVPTRCARCGAPCDSARLALAHCSQRRKRAK